MADPAPLTPPLSPSWSSERQVHMRAPIGRGATAARTLARVIDAAAWAGSRTPAPAAHALAVAGGTVEWALRPPKRRRLAANLARAVGQDPSTPAVRRLVRVELQNEARRSADLLWALGDRDALRRSTAIEGRGHIEAALARGRGAILAGLHLGGWEIAASVAEDAIPGRTVAVVADDWLAWAMEDRRRAVGLGVVPRQQAAVGAARALRRGETVLLLGDDGWGAQPRAHAVRFLGGVAALPAGIVSLARLCQAPIVSFTFLPRGARRWVGRFDPPLDPPARDGGDAEERRVLQLLADRWSEVVRAAPEHWAASFPIAWAPA